MHSAVSLRHTQSSEAGALWRRLCAVALAVMIGTGLAHAQQQRSEIATHPDGTQEWMAFFKDCDGKLLALMTQVTPA